VGGVGLRGLAPPDLGSTQTRDHDERRGTFAAIDGMLAT